MRLWSKGRELVGACALIIRGNPVMVVSVFCYFICFFLRLKGREGLFTKAWFSYVGKIPDDLKFYCFPTVPDFAD